MIEGLLPALCLMLLGTGGLIFLFGRELEPPFRGTAYGILRMKWKRFLRWICLRPDLSRRLEEKRKQMQRRRMDQAVYESSMLLRNLAIVEKGQAFSADYLYEQLMEQAGCLRPAYAGMLSLYRTGRDREAFEHLRESIGTRAGRNFSFVPEKVDRINPEELVEQMEVFQEMMRQQKMTDDMKTVQRNSLLTTAAAAAGVFVMLIDFAVVVVFMHTISLLEGVF